MRPRISEFSYGFGLTRELIDQKWKGIELTAAPFLPSLTAEGRPGGGFDVKLQGIGLMVFLQFKVSHRMTRSTAKGVGSGVLGIPHYRFDIHAPKASDQHQLLTELEQSAATTPRIVRYVAPAFFSEGEFNSAFLTGSISDRSVFVAPSAIPLPDAEEHCVAFERASGPLFVLSEPTKLSADSAYGAFERSVVQAARASRPIDVDGPEVRALEADVIKLIHSVRSGANERRGLGVDMLAFPHVEDDGAASSLDEEWLKRMRPLDAIGLVAWTLLSCQAIAVAPIGSY